MKNKYIRPISSVYEISTGNRCAVGILISSEEDEEDSRQAREYNSQFSFGEDVTDKGNSSNILEEW